MIRKAYDGGWTLAFSIFGYGFYFRLRGKDNPRKPRFYWDCERGIR